VIEMVAKKHKKGRPSSFIDRKRIELLLQKGVVKRRMKIGTHRINYVNSEEE
tara:strand:- start:157 stop:312 length:156 start_codon:yes stop_codon:yes gene_type:complete